MSGENSPKEGWSPGIGTISVNDPFEHFFPAMSDNTAIQYYIPEDGDDLEHPNVVMMKKKASTITLGDIRDVRSGSCF